jgi:predicted transcriptional regulator
MAVRVWKKNLVMEDLAGQKKTGENVTKVRRFVRSDRCLTVRMIGSELNLNNRAVHYILTKELGIQKVRAKLGTKQKKKKLIKEQRENNECAPGPS